jgi:hypothetical protein
MFWKGSTATVAGLDDPEKEDPACRLTCQNAIAMMARIATVPAAQATFVFTVLLAFDSLGVAEPVFPADALTGAEAEADELAMTASSSSELTTAARPDSVSRRSLINSDRISEAC